MCFNPFLSAVDILRLEEAECSLMIVSGPLFKNRDIYTPQFVTKNPMLRLLKQPAASTIGHLQRIKVTSSGDRDIAAVDCCQERVENHSRLAEQMRNLMFI